MLDIVEEESVTPPNPVEEAGPQEGQTTAPHTPNQPEPERDHIPFWGDSRHADADTMDTTRMCRATGY